MLMRIMPRTFSADQGSQRGTSRQIDPVLDLTFMNVGIRPGTLGQCAMTTFPREVFLWASTGKRTNTGETVNLLNILNFTKE